MPPAARVEVYLQMDWAAPIFTGLSCFAFPEPLEEEREKKKGVEMSGMDPVKWKCLIRSGVCGKREKKKEIATDRYSFSLDAICASIVDIVGGLPGFY